MIPLVPFSTLTCSVEFVTEEWTTYFADSQVDQAQHVGGGWKGFCKCGASVVRLPD